MKARIGVALSAIALSFLNPVFAAAQKNAKKAGTVCESCIRANVEFLASDSLRGRGSASDDELITAEWVASEFKKLGLEPLQGKPFILPVQLTQRPFEEPPTVRFTSDGKETVLTHGKEIALPRMTRAQVQGKAQHIKVADLNKTPVQPDSIVILDKALTFDEARQRLQGKPLAIVKPATDRLIQMWTQVMVHKAGLATLVNGQAADEDEFEVVNVRPEAMSALENVPDGTLLTIGGKTNEKNTPTRNVVGVLRGSDPKLKDEFIMFSAHMDHIGICAKEGDTICNGADDDGSGTATVLELARLFTAGKRPKRSVLFTTFGSEELGLLGSRGFANQPPLPLSSIVADIEFEQTGLPEEKIGGKGFWMTGSQLSDLRTLLSTHGSQLADDPFTGNPFFYQSDNFSLASKGVVAHTIGGAAEFPDYHRPGDSADKLDYKFMADSIESLWPGLEWLVNSDARPAYEKGKNPAGK